MSHRRGQRIDLFKVYAAERRAGTLSEEDKQHLADLEKDLFRELTVDRSRDQLTSEEKDILIDILYVALHNPQRFAGPLTEQQMVAESTRITA